MNPHLCGFCERPLGDALDSIDHLCAFSDGWSPSRKDICRWCLRRSQWLDNNDMCKACYIQAGIDDARTFSTDDPWADAMAEQRRIDEDERIRQDRREADARVIIQRSIDALNNPE